MSSEQFKDIQEIARKWKPIVPFNKRVGIDPDVKKNEERVNHLLNWYGLTDSDSQDLIQENLRKDGISE